MLEVRRREIWLRLVIDPLAQPMGRRLARLPWITANRVTATAAVTGVGAATCFATGQLRLGGVLFMIRFLLDVVDGVVARTQAAASARGAAWDLAADVFGIGLCFGAISWYLIRTDHIAAVVPLLLLPAVIFYNWVLAYRKSLANQLDLVGDGGAMGTVRTRLPVLRGWFAFSERLNMNPIPWAIEAETISLGLGPLVLPTRYVWIGLATALAFYVLADLVNLRRVLALADTLQSRQQELAS